MAAAAVVAGAAGDAVLSLSAVALRLIVVCIDPVSFSGPGQLSCKVQLEAAHGAAVTSFPHSIHKPCLKGPGQSVSPRTQWH